MSRGNILVPFLVLTLIVLGGLVWHRERNLDLPGSEPQITMKQTPPDGTTEEIMVTDGIKHSVPLDEVVGGGPPKDGIPSIDNPKFISPQEASDWRKKFPNGKVLSRDTGVRKFYGIDPYGNYYSDNDRIISRVNNQDNRLENKDFVLGVVIDGRAKAYYPPAIKEKGWWMSSRARPWC